MSSSDAKWEAISHADFRSDEPPYSVECRVLFCAEARFKPAGDPGSDWLVGSAL